eukprot:4566414-Lingulodinium_polyedra.AAC.1
MRGGPQPPTAPSAQTSGAESSTIITSVMSNVSQIVQPPPPAKTGAVGPSTVDMFLAVSEALVRGIQMTRTRKRNATGGNGGKREQTVVWLPM